jgi:hypothetical protein
MENSQFLFQENHVESAASSVARDYVKEDNSSPKSSRLNSIVSKKKLLKTEKPKIASIKASFASSPKLATQEDVREEETETAQDKTRFSSTAVVKSDEKK